MERVKSELKVFNESSVAESPGVIPGLKLSGSSRAAPSIRASASAWALATFGPGTHEHLHWHLIETFHYVVAGRAS